MNKTQPFCRCLKTFAALVVLLCTTHFSRAQLNLITSSISSNPNVGTVQNPSYLVGIDANNCPVTAPTANYIAVKLCNPTANAIYIGNMTYTGATIPGVHLTGGQATTQFVGLLAAGECRNIFWHLTWPCNPNNADVLFNINYQLNNGVNTQNLTYNVTKRKLIDANAGGIVTNFTVNNANLIGAIVTVTAEYSFANFPNTNAVLAWQPISDSLFNSGCFQLIGTQVVGTNAPSCVPVGYSDMCKVPPGGNGTVCDNMIISVQYAFMATCPNTSSTLVPMTYATSGGQLKKRVGINGVANIGVVAGNDPLPTITKTANKSVVRAGDTITYNIAMCNSSLLDTVVVSSITDSLPPDMKYIGIAPSSNVTAAECSLASVPNVNVGNVLNFLGNVGAGFYKSFMIPSNSCRTLSINCVYEAPAGSNLFTVQNNKAVYKIGNYTSPVASTTTFTATHPQFIALNDINATLLNTPVSGNVALNDFPELNGANSLLSGPVNGNIVFNSNGTYTYTPDAGFTGTEIISYTICSPDPNAFCDTASLTITVTPPFANAVNILIAENDNVTTPVNTPVDICVLCNDSDPNGNLFGNPAIVQNPANGSLVLNPNGTLTYTPNPGFTGSDLIVYTICDNGVPALCDTASIYIDIPSTPVAVNQTYANDDAFSTFINTSVNGNVGGNDTDPQGHTVNFAALNAPANGILIFNPDGSFIYTPTPGYNGPDQFTYSKCDNGVPVICDTATVYFGMFKPLMDANADINQTLVNTSVSGSVATNDEVFDGSLFAAIGAMNNGTLVLNPNGTYTYLPAPGFVGTDMVQYTVCSPAPSNVCDTATLSITVIPAYQLNVNTVVAQNDNVTTPFNTAITVCIICNDNDPQGQPLSIPVLISAPLNGTAIVNPNGTLTFTPNAGFSGEVVLQYSVCDNNNPVACDTAAIFIEVLETPANVNQTYANDDAYVTLMNAALTGDLGLNDTDPQNDFSIFTLLMNPANGTVTVNPNGTFMYTPNAAFTGPDQFTYLKCDAGNPQACQEATVYITVLNANAPLPALLTSFGVTSMNCNQIVSWSTAQELNVDRYEIEKMNIGGNYKLIAVIRSGGNNLLSKDYSYTDVNEANGVIAYRLKIVDIDGQFKYSDIQTVNNDCNPNGDINLYPNPSATATTLTVNTAKNLNYDVKVRNAIGQVVFNTTFNVNNGSKSVNIPLSQMASGIYTVTVTDSEKQSKTIRFQKLK